MTGENYSPVEASTFVSGKASEASTSGSFTRFLFEGLIREQARGEAGDLVKLPLFLALANQHLPKTQDP